jgi:hypothetical protein
MYSVPMQAGLMVWHWHNHNQDGLVSHATNSNQWKFIDGQWLAFAQEPRNVWLGLAIDGVNPFGEKQSTWST